jgi:hypothetical protein
MMRSEIAHDLVWIKKALQATIELELRGPSLQRKKAKDPRQI